jgi:hypothetical protein
MREDDSSRLIILLTPFSRFAANAILLPSMHMLSNLRPTDASSVIEHIDSLEGRSEDVRGRDMWEHFRGAFGRTIGEQVSMYEWNTGKTGEAQVDDRQTASEWYSKMLEQFYQN